MSAAVERTYWLNAQRVGLDHLDQPLLDAWLADRAATALGRSSRSSPGLIATIAAACVCRRAVPARVLALDDQRRLASLRGLLHDDAIDPQLRLAGCLVALYA